ncbi:mannose-6-phosphate isomerase [Paenibacillus campinasensis]|uniref:Mannose-6-phosphate isomerase n=1 Tax=Paenibacillus campinasensis TaxID=66347 RepID=A0ABW9T683_9BACL|nr:class I mannose-6-phosphate isomerase [Paenibacillus campinasensis]MUG68845.1 mannose-6-phosphate isomerase [Paenibacillus campinasensis]
MSVKYNKEPVVVIPDCEQEAWQGYEQIGQELARRVAGRTKAVIVIECYPGVRTEEVTRGLGASLPLQAVFEAEEAALSTQELEQCVAPYLTEDRVFGRMAPFQIEDFYDPSLVRQLRERIADIEAGIVLVLGFGASLMAEGDVLVYADLARWEIQLRYRSKEMGNWRADNKDEDVLRKYKRGYFIEWRTADRLKRRLAEEARIDYYLDTNRRNDPRAVTWNAFMFGLSYTAQRPFRLVPYFDPGVWGGYWMQEKLGLPEREHPYAWAFDGVPEENSLYFQYGGIRLESPAVNLVFFQPQALLGERVYARFGAEFPIRFDFLDTMGGQNLSLQVHPTAEYMQRTFGLSYTQDESYYMLDAMPDAKIYLGLREGVDADRMMAELEEAQRGGAAFAAEDYIHIMPAKKHDHFLIPAGTIHCSGRNAMVLEISATPYIFTFKLWDWGRLGLDGKPRPVHLEHGKCNVARDRTANWVDEQLVNRIERVAEGDGWVEERTGLHESQFIETRRHWFSVPVEHHTEGSVHMLNLVEGDEAIVESPSGAFEPFTVRYAETFIIPAAVGVYTIRPGEPSRGKTLATIRASVRS